MMTSPSQTTESPELIVARQRLRFVRAMNHDLRNPIATQLNLIESLLDGIPGPVTERQNTYFQRLDEKSRQLLGLLNDVMELAGRSSPAEEDEATLLELPSLSGSLTRLMSPLAIRVGKVVKVDFTIPIVVRCPSVSDLKLLILSLGADVLQHAGAGGELLLRLHRVSGHASFDIRDIQYAPAGPDSKPLAPLPAPTSEDLQVATLLAGRLGVTWTALTEGDKAVGYRVSL